jgi:hypothetical protein
MSRHLPSLLLVLAASLSGCIPYPIQETPHVSGVVVDANTRRPITGAKASFDKYQQKPAFTDGGGRFDISAISTIKIMPLAPYDFSAQDLYLTIDAPGYRPLRVKANTWRGPVGETFTLKHE